MESPPPDILGIILAGGLGRRMGGGDKPLRPLGGQPLLAHVAARLGPQVAGLVLNANGAAERFASFGLPVVADGVPDHPGPLAGVLAALDWAAAQPAGPGWMVSVPGDSPFIPADLVRRLWAARQAAGVMLAHAASGGQAHPPVALWPVALREPLRQALAEGERKVLRCMERLGCVAVEWPATPLDPFFNANTTDDLARAEALLAQARA